jgi:hypothetical protein
VGQLSATTVSITAAVVSIATASVTTGDKTTAEVLSATTTTAAHTSTAVRTAAVFDSNVSCRCGIVLTVSVRRGDEATEHLRCCCVERDFDGRGTRSKLDKVQRIEFTNLVVG